MATLGKAVGIKRVEVTHKPVAKRVARSTTWLALSKVSCLTVSGELTVNIEARI
jgi:hypothetical protein